MAWGGDGALILCSLQICNPFAVRRESNLLNSDLGRLCESHGQRILCEEEKSANIRLGFWEIRRNNGLRMINWTLPLPNCGQLLRWNVCKMRLMSEKSAMNYQQQKALSARQSFSSPWKIGMVWSVIKVKEQKYNLIFHTKSRI